MSKAGTLIGRRYGGFRGVDFRGDDVNISRSPDSLNMWRDYRKLDSIRTRPALETLRKTDDAVCGMFGYENHFVLHVGENLYKAYGYGSMPFDLLYEGMKRGPSYSFNYGDKLYIKDGKNYICYDGERAESVVGYIPTTSIARRPSGGGTVYEDVNMLSSYRKNSFLSDGESTVYHLDTTNIDSDSVPFVTIDGATCVSTSYTVDYEKGTITFSFVPAKPSTDGQDNVIIQFKKSVPGHREAIEKCTILQVFDNRVFFSGNADKPNVIWHTSLDDPTYVSDLDYYQEGLGDSAIKGMTTANNSLWVFLEPFSSDTTVFYHTPTIDSDYGKIYPSVQSSISLGCVGGAVNFNDDVVFFSSRGMEGVVGDITAGQSIAHRSTLVDSRMRAESGYEGMVLTEWMGYLLVCINNHIYLADSRSRFQNGDHIEYEWFYWEIEKNVSSVLIRGDTLFIGSRDGIYYIENSEANVESYWVTPKDKFDNPNKLKTSHKRGCVVESKGDIDVYAKVEDSDFEHIGTYEGVEDYFVSRIKRKKFKDIQLKFSSKTRFILETATLEAFIGGYIKR